MSPSPLVRLLTVRATTMQRIPLALATVCALAFTAACGADTTMPSRSLEVPSAAQDKITLMTATTFLQSLVSGQLWRTSVAAPITVSAAVSRTQGAVLSIPQLGVTVTIPAGAVSATTTISMTALAGRVVAFDFQPAGTTFTAPLHVTQDLSRTFWLGMPFDVVYFKSTSDIDQSSTKISVSEVIPVKLAGTIASFDIWHFSGYAVSAGRY